MTPQEAIEISTPCPAGGHCAAHPRRDLPGGDRQSRAPTGATTRALCGDLPGWCARLGSATPKRGCPASWESAPRRGTACSGSPGPAELHPFREIRCRSAACGLDTGRPAVPHPREAHGHVLRAGHADHGSAGRRRSPVDEVHGFRYFDDRDLMGFVDGTENPAGRRRSTPLLIGAEDPAFAGGSYVIVQKYLHDLAGWNALPTEAQELHHRPHEIVRHRTGRCGQADFRA